jgi:hypothetical protein
VPILICETSDKVARNGGCDITNRNNPFIWTRKLNDGMKFGGKITEGWLAHGTKCRKNKQNQSRKEHLKIRGKAT